MKTRRAVLSLLLLPSASLLLAAAPAPAPPADDVLPKATPLASYADLINHSPFSPPSAPAALATPPPPPSQDNWAKSFTATSAMQLKGIFSVTLTDRDTNERFLVTSDPKDASANPRGIMLVSVQWSDTPSQTKLTLRRGTEFAEKTLEGSAGGAPGMAPAMPMTPQGTGARPLPTPAPMIRPAGTGGFPAPPPSSPSMIRRPLIRASPAPAMQTAPPLPGSTVGRPPANPAAGRGGAAPQTPADDDDDDDDDGDT